MSLPFWRVDDADLARHCLPGSMSAHPGELRNFALDLRDAKAALLEARRVLEMVRDDHDVWGWELDDDERAAILSVVGPHRVCAACGDIAWGAHHGIVEGCSCEEVKP